MSKKLTDPFAVVGGLGVNDNPIICGGYSKQECFLFEVLSFFFDDIKLVLLSK